MKRLLAALLAICMLAGCAFAEGGESQPPIQPPAEMVAQPPVEPTQPQSVPTNTETTPPTNTETTPPTNTETTPPTNTETTPPTNTGTTPPTNTETTPPTNTETTPPTGGETTPPTGGETTPPTGGETTPPTGGETTPPTGGETTPPTGGETTPPAGGETTPTPGIPDDAEAWMFNPDDPTQIIAGKLEDILQDFDANTEAIVYIRSEELMRVKDKTLNDVVKTQFVPDETVFEKDKFIVRVSEDDPTQAVAAQEEGETVPAPETWLYIWVEEKSTQPDPDPTNKPDPGEMDIFVAAENYAPGAWSCQAPRFTLSGIPEGAKGYSYAVIAYDERFIILSGNTYTSSDEGEYTLRFAILDSIGDVCAMSTRYDLKIDLTPPAYLTASIISEGQPQFILSSEDALSGLDAFSVDGGANWVPAAEDGTYIHTGRLGEIYAQGMLMARDVAGNIVEYPTDFEIPAPIEYPSFGGGGGGGGGGDGEPGINHTGDEDVDTTPYGELNLVLGEEPMHELTIGDTPLELTLELDGAEGLAADASDLPLFTAALARWTDRGLQPWTADAAEEGEDAAHAEYDAPDTLVLTAQIDPAIAGEYAYTWRFNGVVSRLLFNSGVEYLVLRVGDRVTAFSTAGFIAGTEYTDLKAAGVSTRKFDYSVWMRGSTQDPLLGEMAVEAAVEEEIYPLTDDETQPMYYYDFYYGPAALLDVPFGAWTPEMEATEMEETA